MKRYITLLITVAILLSSALTAHAANGKISYLGNAKDFVFEPGSEFSPTDLFTEFKDVMPGDTLTQKITLKNDASKDVKVKVYIRSLGAHEDSVDFLSQISLKVQKYEENEMAYMFDAYANESAQLTDWVCLGMLYSGGEVLLDVILDVPTSLSNEYQNEIGYLDWEFKIEEFPVEESDPLPPQTSDYSNLGLWIAIFIVSALVLVFVLHRKKKENER